MSSKANEQLTGGKVNYYLAQVEHPQREDQMPYRAECDDIIRALNMTFAEGCEFKAIWRTAAARLGNGKPGQKALYDAEKRMHYAAQDVAMYKKAQEPKWVTWKYGEPAPEKDKEVFLKLSSGKEVSYPQKAKNCHWGETSGVIAWRYADAGDNK